MAQAPLYPDALVEERSGGGHAIAGAATSISMFIGWAPRGPIDRANRISSFSDYQRAFGGPDPRALLGYSVKHFFENGGADAYVIRLVGAGAAVASADFGPLTASAASPGEWGDRYKIKVTLRSTTNDAGFKIEALDREADDAIVAENVVNGYSDFIAVKVAANTPPDAGERNLSGGLDGAVLGPSDSEFQSATLACFGSSAIVDRIDLFNLLCVPGLAKPETINALQGHCRRRRAFLIVDSAEGDTVADAMREAAALRGQDAANSAIYFPWIQSPDPVQPGASRNFPPCGFVAGVYSRADRTRGVWRAPAGADASLIGATGLALTVSDAEAGQLNANGVNCLRGVPAHGAVIWGSRTMQADDGDSEWKYVSVRRLALFIEESLSRSLQWVVFEPNDEPLWAQIRSAVSDFLLGLFHRGAFPGQTQRDAFFVKCGRETMTQDDIDHGVVNILIGFAPLRPGEFITLKIRQIAAPRP
jgi:hypothetical protein